MENWKKTWGYVPIDFGTLVGTVEDITQKILIKNNVGGSAVKIKFTNKFNRDTLLLEQVSVGKIDKNSGRITGIVKATYQGNTQIAVPAGQEFYSDSIPLSLEAGEELAISVYLKEKHEIYSLCQTWSGKTLIFSARRKVLSSTQAILNGNAGRPIRSTGWNT